MTNISIYTIFNDQSFNDRFWVVGWCEGVMYFLSPGRPADIGLQLGKACYPCSR